MKQELKQKRCGVLNLPQTLIPEESNIAKTSDTVRGPPPFLTILAGFVVLFGIFWILGSIVMWLFGFFVRPPH